MKHPSKDIPPTDAVFANKRDTDGPTVIIQDHESDHVRRPAPGAARPAAPAASPHTTIIGYESVPGLSSGTGAAKTHNEPIVGWLVVLDGPGKGNHRPIFNGSNTIGRNTNQRIPLDFGDSSISGEQQAFLVYDSKKRQFQIVPNLGRPNLVHLNDSALLTNAELKARDKVTMGQTTLLFVPLCGPDFDWSEMTK